MSFEKPKSMITPQVAHYRSFPTINFALNERLELRWKFYMTFPDQFAVIDRHYGLHDSIKAMLNESKITTDGSRAEILQKKYTSTCSWTPQAGSTRISWHIKIKEWSMKWYVQTGLFYSSHLCSDQSSVKSKTLYHGNGIEHLMFSFKEFWQLSFWDIFIRISRWQRFRYLAFRSWVCCRVSSPFRRSCCGISIPVG